ncbi:uncharacterized protein cubi_03070 [Cryptosporidium ubiquitum]|uniref:Autophagy-related protein n=1 Tax=Cryptosporidium ubiquitum TaxID=857276 RepID=A0A1J4MNB1_9CRYT|nr:uncharacterized protein cubi_03070 [Cryptosporidium ubiquitum]OII74939.1 hypothetical protein cubi_03070 [Cryptosporidium ubiquitum]
MSSLKEKVQFDKRAAEALSIRAKYPNRIPVICERSSRSDLPEIEKKKFLVPMNMLVGEFKYIIHKHITQSSNTQNSGIKIPVPYEKTIYLFVNNTIPKAGSLMQEVYEQYVSDDGFLYVEYSSENAFGGYSSVV